MNVSINTKTKEGICLSGAKGELLCVRDLKQKNLKIQNFKNHTDKQIKKKVALEKQNKNQEKKKHQTNFFLFFMIDGTFERKKFFFPDNVFFCYSVLFLNVLSVLHS